MSTEAKSGSKAVPVVTGTLVGVMIFAGLTLWFGRPFIPTTDDLPTVFKEPPQLTAIAMAANAPAAAPMGVGEQTFTTVCAACHQATGLGIPGAFPPLAGSSWVAQDPETPIRIVLAGLSGPIEVKGAQFNSAMPPPAGLDDEKIAAVLSYVRSHFDNNAPAVDKAKVAEVRAALAGRTAPWTAADLSSLRPK
ncbi:MAG TPA: cytochrome c [Polyangiales bacterium]